VNDAQVAMPYENSPEGFERIRLAKQDANMGPAGGMFSTARDLSRLVVAELNGGRVDGRECVPARVIASTQRARVPQQRQFQDYPRFAWGLGWDIGTYAGDTLIHRFGGFPGYGCHVSFMPSRRVGVVVLVNNGRTGMVLADLVANSVYDVLLGRDDAAARRAAELDTLAMRAVKLHEAIVADKARRAARSQQLSHPLEAYAGTYSNPDWGTLELRVNGAKLEASMGVARSAVEVYDATANKLRVELFGGGDVVEAIFPDGAARAAELRLEDVSYRRK
jgi:CubicO group peptidase (beta-lactamase class C family)